MDVPDDAAEEQVVTEIERHFAVPGRNIVIRPPNGGTSFIAADRGWRVVFTDAPPMAGVSY